MNTPVGSWMRDRGFGRWSIQNSREHKRPNNHLRSERGAINCSPTGMQLKEHLQEPWVPKPTWNKTNEQTPFAHSLASPVIKKMDNPFWLIAAYTYGARRPSFPIRFSKGSTVANATYINKTRQMNRRNVAVWTHFCRSHVHRLFHFTRNSVHVAVTLCKW